MEESKVPIIMENINGVMEKLKYIFITSKIKNYIKLPQIVMLGSQVIKKILILGDRGGGIFGIFFLTLIKTEFLPRVLEKVPFWSQSFNDQFYLVDLAL